MIKNKNKKILVLGATGQIGNTLFKYISKNIKYDLVGTFNNKKIKKTKFYSDHSKFLIYFDAYNEKNLINIINQSKPSYIINCVGIIKPKINKKNSFDAFYLNAYLPHLLSKIIKNRKIKLIHISTDCVFSGIKGNYKEDDLPDPQDLYGVTKFLGEITNNKKIITLRTSYIGRELLDKYGLLEWILQQKKIKGFKYAYFSGLTTLEFSRIIVDIVIPNKKMYGLYNVSAKKYQNTI